MEEYYAPQSVTLYTLNAYLIPGWLVKNREPIRQDERAEAIGTFASEHADLVALQEAWGSNMNKLEEPLKRTHDLIWHNKSINLGVASTIFDASWQFINSNGGLYFAWRRELFKCLFEEHQVFENSGTKSKKGAWAMLLDMTKVWGSLPGSGGRRTKLLIFNTHLDTSKHIQKQIKQIDELYEFISATVSEQHIFFDPEIEGVGSSSTKTKTKTLPVEALVPVYASVGVLLVGDFNFTSKSEVYKHLMSRFNHTDVRLRDIYRHSRGLPPLGPNSSFFSGERSEIEQEEEPTYSESNTYAHHAASEKIDHIFSLESLMPSKGLELLKLGVDSLELVKQAKGREFSDHWGMMLKFRPLVPGVEMHLHYD